MESFNKINLFDDIVFSKIQEFVLDHIKHSDNLKYAGSYGRYWNLIKFPKEIEDLLVSTAQFEFNKDLDILYTQCVKYQIKDGVAPALVAHKDNLFCTHTMNLIIDTTIDFRAYIEDFQDSYNATWDPFKYVGRADTFYKYSGINRTFNVTFVVPALSRADMISNYQKLNTLTWATMPDYATSGTEDDYGYMKGNFVKLTLGDYFRGMPTIINSLTFSPIMEMGFDINRYSTQDEIENSKHVEGQVIKRSEEKLFVGQLPKGIRVQAQMTIIHSFIPQRGQQLIGYEVGSRNPYAIKENGTSGQDVRVSKNDNYVANKPNINSMSGDFN